jgi:hypothetical protein
MQQKLANIDVCSQPIKVPAHAVEDMATFADEMSTIAVEKAHDDFLELKEGIMEYGDLLPEADAVIENATESLLASEQEEAQAALKARQSRKRSRQARAARPGTPKQIQRARMAEELSTKDLLAAARAREFYFNIRDELERLDCKETPPKAPAQGETPLKLWLVEFMGMLYARIPPALKKFPSSETCRLGGIGIHIYIDALERPEEEIQLITQDVCDKLGRQQ